MYNRENKKRGRRYFIFWLSLICFLLFTVATEWEWGRGKILSWYSFFSGGCCWIRGRGRPDRQERERSKNREHGRRREMDGVGLWRPAIEGDRSSSLFTEVMNGSEGGGTGWRSMMRTRDGAGYGLKQKSRSPARELESEAGELTGLWCRQWTWADGGADFVLLCLCFNSIRYMGNDTKGDWIGERGLGSSRAESMRLGQTAGTGIGQRGLE